MKKNTYREREEQLKKLSEQQRLQTEEAERTLEEFKIQMENHSEQIFEEMRKQVIFYLHDYLRVFPAQSDNLVVKSNIPFDCNSRFCNLIPLQFNGSIQSNPYCTLVEAVRKQFIHERYVPLRQKY